MKKILVLASIIGLTVTSQAQAADSIFTIAHRGDSYYAPEHTFAAFDLGVKRKAEVIELDVRFTKDRKLVAFHDKTIDRTTNGKGYIKDKTLKQLKKLDAGSWFNKAYPTRTSKSFKGEKLRTLDEILARYKDKAKIYVEMKNPEKNPGMVEEMYRSLKRNGMLSSARLKRENIVIESFNESSLKKLKTLAPKLSMLYLVYSGDLDKLSDSKIASIRKYANHLALDYRDVNAYKVSRFKKKGFIVSTYTVDKKADMIRMDQYGVNGIFTNRPSLHLKVRNTK